MKVMLVNGSPHEKGCTYTALCEVAKALEADGVETEIFWLGTKAIAGCRGCAACATLKKCVIDDIVNEFVRNKNVFISVYFDMCASKILIWTVTVNGKVVHV